MTLLTYTIAATTTMPQAIVLNVLGESSDITDITRGNYSDQFHKWRSSHIFTVPVKPGHIAVIRTHFYEIAAKRIRLLRQTLTNELGGSPIDSRVAHTTPDITRA